MTLIVLIVYTQEIKVMSKVAAKHRIILKEIIPSFQITNLINIKLLEVILWHYSLFKNA